MTTSTNLAAMAEFPAWELLKIVPALAPKKGAWGSLLPFDRSQPEIVLGDIEEPIRIPFEPSNFDRDDTRTRVNFGLRAY